MSRSGLIRVSKTDLLDTDMALGGTLILVSPEIQGFCAIAAFAEILETDHHRHISLVSVVVMCADVNAAKNILAAGHASQPVLKLSVCASVGTHLGNSVEIPCFSRKPLP
ncbi:MAG: hypothetical protein IJU76_09430 [Desulfovibrionaceae bacterium]|nr:hypothetical protein [Desulfovibrionaceae bacterium]